MADYMRSDQANTESERSVKFVPVDVTADQGGDRSSEWGAIASPLSVGPAVGKAESPGQKFQRIRPRVDQTSSEVANDFNSRRTLPTIKLEQYNGFSPLETHFAKLNSCADYFNWTVRDRLLCHLKASLEGHAGQVLWELGPTSTEEEIIKLLRNRFGNVNQMERYRAELRSRHHKRGKSIQTVHQDVRRLLALGFPGHSGELCELIGRDAFLEALADPALRVRVLDQQPATLDDALVTVCRMEAYGTGVTVCAVGDGDGDRKHVRAVGASDGDADQREALVARRIQQLEQGMAEQKREIRQLRASGNRFDDSTTTVHQHYVASGGQPCPPVYYQRGDWPPTMTPSSIPSGQQHTYFIPEEPGTSSASWHGATTIQGPVAAVLSQRLGYWLL